MAAARGKPVYVEKPMATTGADCDAMRSACAEAGVPLFVAYYRRALPRFLQVRALLADGAIGDPVAVVVTHLGPPAGSESASLPGWRVTPEIAGGGYFVDLGSHTLDLLDFLLGPVQRADGGAANRAGPVPGRGPGHRPAHLRVRRPGRGRVVVQRRTSPASRSRSSAPRHAALLRVRR